MIKGFVPADFAPQRAAAAAPAARRPRPGRGRPRRGVVPVHRQDGDDAAQGGRGQGPAGGRVGRLGRDGQAALPGHRRRGLAALRARQEGDKQIKAEELNAAGGEHQDHLRDGVPEDARRARRAGGLAGRHARRLRAALGDGDGAAARPTPPLAQFAIKYIRRHHPDIALAETDRPVDPGAEIPAEFLTLRARPSRCSPRPASRSATSRWSWPAGSSPAGRRRPTSWSRWPRCPHADVRQFVAEALLADDAPEHRRYRIDPETLGPAAVYRFCESADESTRALGMRLIERSPRFQAARGAVPPDREPRPPGPGVRDPRRSGRSTATGGSPPTGSRPSPPAGDRRAPPRRRPPRPRPTAAAPARPPGPSSCRPHAAEPLGFPPPDAVRDPARPARRRREAEGSRRAPQAAPRPQGEAGAGRGDARPGPGGRRLRPGRLAAPRGVHGLPRRERAGRVPGGRDPASATPTPAPATAAEPRG